MQRLLQGDVGSGKTAVALYTLLRAVESGRQGALMAPTETLAEQHFLTIEGLCAELGVRVALLTSSITARERRAAHQLVASGDVGRRRRHARADPARGRVRGPRGGRRRRAAPFRRRAAGRARRGTEPARPPHDRDADSADARPHRVRRSRGVGDRRPARGSQADRDGLGDRGAERRGVRTSPAPPRRRPPGVRRLPARRGLRDDARARCRGRGRAAPGERAPRVPRRLRPRPPEDGRAPRADGGVQRTESSTCSSRRP